MTVLQSMKLGIDVNRHKEILVKAVAAILLLLLKHLKMNHVYQFEFMSQHLVFANCIPLVLKFFNQNIMAYIGAKNKYVVKDESLILLFFFPAVKRLTLSRLQHRYLGFPILCHWRPARVDSREFGNWYQSALLLAKSFLMCQPTAHP